MLMILIVLALFLAIGAVAKVLNNWNELNAARTRPMARPASGGGSGGVVRQTNSDMDRFLAEIDRLRKKNADQPTAAPAKKAVPVAPVVQPVKQSERPRARVVAELAEPPKTDLGFTQPTPAPTTGPKPGDLPIAMVVTPPSGTGAPATKVTRIASRPRPAAKTPFAKNLTTLLGSGNGLAMAIVLQEILGPRKGSRG
jgi:hypothetical protein